MKMDKTAFSAFKKSKEPNDFLYWQGKTIKERLEAAAYLISVAYGHSVDNPPKVDRTKFEMLKRS